jgi:Xaa-Pro aminopeptidase
MSFNLSEMQSDLRAAGMHGWLFYDFRGRDPIAQRILQLPPGMRTRRWFYFVPAKGTPKKLVHRIETESLSAVPGDTLCYSAQEELRGNLKKLIGRATRIAMQYSPKNANLVQKYEAVWSPEQLDSHLYAAKHVDRIVAEAFQRAARGVREKRHETEYGLQQWILEQFAAAELMTEEGPDIAVNAHASDPHYGPSPDRPTQIKEGDLLLLDVWAKRNTPGSVYYDITWVGYLGAKPPEKIANVFNTVRDARDKAVDLILTSIAKGKPLQGWQVDKAARGVIEKAGLGKYFFHRTGHNIGTSVHGNGANMDGIETHDVRHLIPGTCTSVEPGIYLPEFGIRSEVNVFIGQKEARVTGAIQKELLALLA